jgi:chromate transporter
VAHRVVTAAPPSFGEALRVWLKIGCLGFGGPSGQIALLHKAVVQDKGWVDEAEFVHGLSLCMLLPGPEAQQLAVWLGWRLHGVRGGVAAGLLFVLPGLAIMLGLSSLYIVYGRSDWAEPVLLGLKAAVVALVAQALVRISGRVLDDGPGRMVALTAFLLLSCTSAPFPLLILAAGVVGWLLGGGAVVEVAAISQAGRRGALKAALICLVLWLAPVAAVWALAPDSVVARLGVVFSGLAVVSFGGAYAALAYLGQVVSAQGWLTPAQMLDGVGLAETTPGPLVLVFTFVGFLVAYQASSPPWAWAAGLIGGLMAAWTTFAPSFLWVFAGGPFMQGLRTRPRPARALALISAAAVGVIGQLAAWFATHLLFRAGEAIALGPFQATVPRFASLDIVALGLTLLALGLTFALRLPALALVAVMIAAALALRGMGLG